MYVLEKYKKVRIKCVMRKCNLQINCFGKEWEITPYEINLCFCKPNKSLSSVLHQL